jgi:hypothetical protein
MVGDVGSFDGEGEYGYTGEEGVEYCWGGDFYWEGCEFVFVVLSLYRFPDGDVGTTPLSRNRPYSVRLSRL